MNIIINRNDDLSRLSIYARLYRELSNDQKLGVNQDVPTILIYDDQSSKTLFAYGLDKVADYVAANMQTGAFERCVIVVSSFIYLFFTNSLQVKFPEVLTQPAIGNA